jgi:hypothetical protein
MPTLATQAPPLTCAGLFFEQTSSYKTGAYTWTYLYEKRNKETRVDIYTGSRAENTSAKENANCKNCTNPEADRRRDTTESIQSWIVTRHARLTSPNAFREDSPMRWLEELIGSYKEQIIVLMFVVFLTAHFFLKKRDYTFVFLMGFCAIVVIFGFVAEVFIPDNGILFRQLATLLIVYGISLYIILSDAMLLGLASYLTKKWGRNWVKAMDYPYLFLGTLGILMSASRLDIVTDRFSRIDILGPLVVTTAVIIRFVKTRADIAGWNEPS